MTRDSLGRNITITADEIHAIRGFDDFDLKMFISEVNDHGWTVARQLIPLIVAANSRGTA